MNTLKNPYLLFFTIAVLIPVFAGFPCYCNAANPHRPDSSDQPLPQPSDSPHSQAVVLELPLVDYPFNWTDGYTAPSMQQSLYVSKDIYQYSHYKFSQMYRSRPVARALATAGFDVISLWLPFGAAWMHEEWHRAVLSRRGIDSFDEIYEFPLFAETISVKNVKDEDLIRLKKNHPAEMVRLQAAGIEAQYELNFTIEKDRFFVNPPTLDDAILWLNYINNISYLYACATNESNVITDELLQNENQDISQRDFTGLDCDAWVYDLFRPTEPYEQRGIHPSGVGIKRYIKFDELSPAEQDYLKTNLKLSFLNLADPFLYRVNSFTASNPFNGQPFRWNVTLRHHLTSFGYSVDANFFYQQNLTNAVAIFHHYFNKDRFFPGLELSIIRLPITLARFPLAFSARLALWLQPKDQQFYTKEADWGGVTTLKLNFPINSPWETFVELEAKTPGWVAGNVYLGSNASLRVGVGTRLF